MAGSSTDVQNDSRKLEDIALQELGGVDIYDSATLEKGVVQNINKALQEKEINEIKKKVSTFQQEIRILKNEIERIEKERRMLSIKSYSETTLLKLKTFTTQNEKLQQKLKIFENKLIKAQLDLRIKSQKANESNLETASNLSKTQVEDQSAIQFSYDTHAVSTAKTLKERTNLIRLGLATPFSFHTPDNSAQAPLKLDDTFSNSLDASRESEVASKSKLLKLPTLKISKRKLQTKGVDNVLHKKKRRSSEEYKPSSPEIEVEEEDVEELDFKKVKQHRQRLVIDDANPKAFKKRLDAYKQELMREQAENRLPPEDKLFNGGLKVPGRIWHRLYKYQQTGVKWLWELHTQRAGGILGDEMGLGKTIQVIALFASLSKSKLRDRDGSYSYDGLGPVLIVCPATVMHQWVREFHTWAPFLRVAVLHSSGSHKGSQRDLISNIALSRGVLVTSYERVRLAIDHLLGRAWHYIVLDEGHKIRNPNAGVTHAVKLFPTPHRLILSGSPIQNHLRELWSLFDFVFPGKLGTLPIFMEQFSVPIVQGGYASASEVQVQTAYKCACMLRSTISPYLLRRMKQDVQSHINLPEKTDQVLFCSLTPHQIETYQSYLDSNSVHSILSGKLKVFVGLIQLRKICNHPDLFTGGPKVLAHEPNPEYGDERRYGFWKRSGKMIVVESLLKIWKRQSRKVLLFTQSKMMLNILEDFVKSEGYTYLTMHGSSAIGSRQLLVKRFNEDPGIFVFILTTRVGGLGVNLIGADRVVIYDPDWNPSTDAQAQERAWRIGQNKQVTIYRLLTTGSIEEKIYHRQIFKHFVSNRILKDPKQRRFFKANDMHELFILGNQDRDAKTKQKTETAAIFAGTGSEVKIKPRSRKSASKYTSSDVVAPTKTNKSSNLFVFRNDDCNSVSPLRPKQKFPSLKKDGFSQSAPFETDQSQIDSMKPFSPDNQLQTELVKPLTRDQSQTANIDSPSTSDQSRLEHKKFESNEALLEQKHDAAQSNLPSTSRFESAESLEYNSAVSNSGSCDNSSEKSAKLKSSFMQALKKFKENRSRETKSRHKSKNNVDGEVVANVVKKSKLKHRKDQESERKKSDDYVLSKLFSKGVHSALKHTTIMESTVADYALVEAEANRVAKEAVRNVRLSRRKYKYPSQKQAKTTKRFGNETLHKPVERNEPKPQDENESNNLSSLFGNPGPMSSSSLLLQIKRRNHVETDQIEDEVVDDDPDDFQDDLVLGRDDKLLNSLVEFLSSQNKYRATAQEILEQLEGDLEPGQAAMFKAMLYKVCTKTTADNDQIFWVLNEEFR